MTEAAAAPAAQEPEPLPYKCDQCDRTFARPLNLGRHKQAIHGVTGTAPSSVATREKNAAKRKRPAAASPPAPVEAKMAPSGKPSAGPVRVRQQEPATTAGQVRLLLNEMRMVNAERDQHLVDLISELERENSLLRKERDEVKAKLAKVSHQLDELAIAFK